MLERSIYLCTDVKYYKKSLFRKHIILQSDRKQFISILTNWCITKSSLFRFVLQQYFYLFLGTVLE